MDGSSIGKLGPDGIGGVFRDNAAVVKMVFSKPVGVTNSNVAKLLAIKEAILIFIASCWVHSHNLIIESDSSNVVKWIHNFLTIS